MEIEESKDLNNMTHINIYNKEKMHSPTLDSIKMVEETIKKYSQEYGKYGIWKKLPKKMMYQTFLTVIDYLIESHKIMICKDGIIIWTYDSETIQRIIKEGLIIE